MRSPEALKPRETHRTPDWPGAELSLETIRAYLADLSGRGRRESTVQMYSAKLRALYDYLPPDKQIFRGTLAAWRAFLLEAGYSPSTVNTHLSAANGLMEYMGRRDLQLVGQLEADKGHRPELSRVEYLRLLQAARTLEKERTYLLVKVFALVGIRVVVVHGGGPEISAMLKKLGKESRFVDGLRCTDAETMDVVQSVLCGKVNKNLVAQLNRLGGQAIGLCGIDGGFLTAKSAGGDHPCTGELVQVDGGLLEDFLSKGYTPVVATIAQGAEDPTQVYSVSANHTAAKLAVALHAEKLILLTDVRGLLRDAKNEETLIHVVELPEVPGLVKDGIIQGGMIPKVDCCVEAVRSGVERTHILDGRIPHSILIEMLSDEGIGTMLL